MDTTTQTLKGMLDNSVENLKAEGWPPPHCDKCNLAHWPNLDCTQHAQSIESESTPPLQRCAICGFQHSRHVDCNASIESESTHLLREVKKRLDKLDGNDCIALPPSEFVKIPPTYKLIHAESDTQLAHLVNQSLREGWQISGSVACVTSAQGRNHFYQAMIKL